MAKQLIFGIGMNKTGTKSLATALSMLGFPCKHAARTIKWVVAANRDAGKPILDGLTDEYTAFADSPINVLFKELDETYPGSKFIYTWRDGFEWAISRVAQFGGTYAEHQRKSKAHKDAVLTHFVELQRHDALLIFNLCDAPHWEPLCNFLDVPIPDKPFPHKNRTGAKRKERARRQMR